MAPILELQDLPILSEAVLQEQYALLNNAIEKATSSVASVTKRDKGIGVTKQYHFGYRVSKACQNHMPVKEWVLNGERIDEQESDALIDCHGFDILSDVSVLPALHAMPAMQLLSDALFKGYVEKEFWMHGLEWLHVLRRMKI